MNPPYSTRPIESRRSPRPTMLILICVVALMLYLRSGSQRPEANPRLPVPPHDPSMPSQTIPPQTMPSQRSTDNSDWTLEDVPLTPSSRAGSPAGNSDSAASGSTPAPAEASREDGWSLEVVPSRSSSPGPNTAVRADPADKDQGNRTEKGDWSLEEVRPGEPSSSRRE